MWSGTMGRGATRSRVRCIVRSRVGRHARHRPLRAGTRRRGRRCHTLHHRIAVLFDDLMALLRAHLPPLPLQFPPLFLGSLTKLLILLAHALLLLRRQALELVPALA